jgi:hypothetical protein
MVKQMSRGGWKQRRKKYPRVSVELTVDEYARWLKRCGDLGQKSATRLRRLIQIDLAHRSADPLVRAVSLN